MVFGVIPLSLSPHASYQVYSPRYEGCTNDSEGIGAEMERMAARMGGSVKFPFNESECLDADFFKIVADHLIRAIFSHEVNTNYCPTRGL